MVTRRRVLGTGLTTVAAVAGTGAALWPALTASAGGTAAAGPPVDPLFDEVYRGRRIQGFGAADAAGVSVLVDGRPLGLMRRVDGTWISMANHYQAYPTPLATARGAVDIIGRAGLGTIAAAHQGH